MKKRILLLLFFTLNIMSQKEKSSEMDQIMLEELKITFITKILHRGL